MCNERPSVFNCFVTVAAVLAWSTHTSSNQSGGHRWALRPAERHSSCSMSWFFLVVSFQWDMTETPPQGGVPGVSCADAQLQAHTGQRTVVVQSYHILWLTLLSPEGCCSSVSGYRNAHKKRRCFRVLRRCGKNRILADFSAAPDCSTEPQLHRSVSA